MKSIVPILIAGLGVLALAGCSTPVEVTGSYDLPGTNITANVNIGTNGATVGASYQTGTTNVGGTVTVGK